MPRLKEALGAEDRFNTLMSVVALLQREGEIHIDDLAKRFDVSTKTMRKMVSTLNTASFFPRNSEEQVPYWIDIERIDEEDGVVCLSLDEGPSGVPRISGVQTVALLSGLSYLKSLPDFAKDEDLDKLVELLSTDQPVAPEVSYDQNQVDADFAVLKTAILTDKRISCRYVNSKGIESVRKIDPLLLVTAQDTWYLKGYCLTRKEIRTFRLDHMVDAKLTKTARGEEALEAAANLDETAPIYNPNAHDVEVELELGPEAYKLAASTLEFEDFKKGKGGNIRVVIKFGYLPDLGPLVCRFGSNARVIRPAAAKEVVRKYAEQALASHSEKVTK